MSCYVNVLLLEEYIYFLSLEWIWNYVCNGFKPVILEKLDNVLSDKRTYDNKLFVSWKSSNDRVPVERNW